MKRFLSILSLLALLIGINVQAATQINDTVAIEAQSQAQATTIKFPKVMADVNIGGIVYQDFTAATTTGTSITTLYTKVLPANTINAKGRGIKITAWGTNAATADDKTTIISVGGVTLGTTALHVGNATAWKLEVILYRTSGGAVGQAMASGYAATAIIPPTWVATTLDFATDLTILVRTTDEVAGGTLAKGWQIEQF